MKHKPQVGIKPDFYQLNYLQEVSERELKFSLSKRSNGLKLILNFVLYLGCKQWLECAGAAPDEIVNGQAWPPYLSIGATSGRCENRPRRI